MAENKNAFVGFIGPSYTTRIGRFDRQRSINLYLEMDALGYGKDKEVAMLISCPGVKLQDTIGSGPIRAIYVPSSRQDLMYVISGAEVWLYSDLTTKTKLVGTMLTTDTPVSIADNGTSVMWVDGTHGYYHSFADTTFHLINDAHFYPASTITFQDGYFILNQTDSGYFFLSNLYDTTFYSLNEANQSGVADNLVGLICNNRELYLFGESSTEIWWNQGASGVSPFSRQDGKFIQYGCASAQTIKALDNSIFWLAKNPEGGGFVFTMKGDQPQRISNHAIEFALRSYGDLSGASAWVYQEDGHTFYVLDIPGAPTTWVFDGMTQQWHERQSNVAGDTVASIRTQHAYYKSQHVVGDKTAGKIYLQSLEINDEAGAPFVRTRQSPHVADNLKMIFFGLLEIDFKFGVGLNAGVGVPQNAIDPRAILEISNDGGETWGNPLYARLGKLGDNYARARWQRLGRSRDRIFRVSVSDPVQVAMIGAELDVNEGTA